MKYCQYFKTNRQTETQQNHNNSKIMCNFALDFIFTSMSFKNIFQDWTVHLWWWLGHDSHH